jgi:hypothetical protein
MIKNKRAYCLAAILLSIVMLSPMMFSVAAQTNSFSSSIGTWDPPKNFVDPVTSKIQELKIQGLNNDQITTNLAELGMGWYPETGATWIGRALTSDELANMPDTLPAKGVYQEKSVTDEYILAIQTDRTSCMRTNTASWSGVSSEIVSGSMNVATSQTKYNYLCMQLGALDSGTNWVETVLTHNLGETYRWSTYDNDEGQWINYMDKNTPITSVDTYIIMLDGTQDAYGWNYDVWINYQWVRSGHLSSLSDQGGFQKEVYSDSGSFTSDSSHAVFYRNWLHTSQGWSYWTNSINTWWSTVDPVKESHSMGSLSYRWETWV